MSDRYHYYWLRAVVLFKLQVLCKYHDTEELEKWHCFETNLQIKQCFLSNSYLRELRVKRNLTLRALCILQDNVHFLSKLSPLMLSYLTKCTVVICRKGVIIWKVHIFAFGKQRTMNCSESHPSLKDNIRIGLYQFCRPSRATKCNAPS